MEKEELKEYNKTWYWKLTFPWQRTPKNWISGSAKSFLGIRFIIWRVAKSNYKWSKD